MSLPFKAGSCALRTLPCGSRSPVNILRGEQFEPAFGVLDPNHRIPAIVDHAPVDGGPPLPMFESGAILLYLAQKTGALLPASAHLDP
jgi:GSH-dependent disulfide-bond oxidoreductase